MSCDNESFREKKKKTWKGILALKLANPRMSIPSMVDTSQGNVTLF